VQQNSTITRQKLSDYYHVMKPSVVYLLAFTGIASYVAAAGWKTSPIVFLAVIVSVSLASAAANIANNYFDRDIDALMHRTCLRAIPMGRIKPRNAMGYSLALLATSLGLSYVFLTPISTVFLLVGYLDYALVYSYLVKRRNWSNILMGGFAGVMPVLVGYFACATPLISPIAALFVGFLVFFWIPEHIWSLAIRYRDDYAHAKVPMLPTIIPETRSIQVVAITTIVMVLYSLLPAVYPTLGLGVVYLGIIGALDAAVLALNLWLLKNPTAKRAWTVFKFSSPYLFFAFIAVMLDVLL
jgi:protoheme IX farnesyltransferase